MFAFPRFSPSPFNPLRSRRSYDDYEEDYDIYSPALPASERYYYHQQRQQQLQEERMRQHRQRQQQLQRERIERQIAEEKRMKKLAAMERLRQEEERLHHNQSKSASTSSPVWNWHPFFAQTEVDSDSEYVKKPATNMKSKKHKAILSRMKTPITETTSTTVTRNVHYDGEIAEVLDLELPATPDDAEILFL